MGKEELEAILTRVKYARLGRVEDRLIRATLISEGFDPKLVREALNGERRLAHRLGL